MIDAGLVILIVRPYRKVIKWENCYIGPSSCLTLKKVWSEDSFQWINEYLSIVVNKHKRCMGLKSMSFYGTPAN